MSTPTSVTLLVLGLVFIAALGGLVIVLLSTIGKAARAEAFDHADESPPDVLSLAAYRRRLASDPVEPPDSGGRIRPLPLNAHSE